jgi:translocator protein
VLYVVIAVAAWLTAGAGLDRPQAKTRRRQLGDLAGRESDPDAAEGSNAGLGTRFTLPGSGHLLHVSTHPDHRTLAGAREPLHRDLVLFVACAAAVAVAAVVGSLAATGGDPDLYAALDLPAWAPPPWVFSPVWGILYVVIAVAAWLTARAGLDRPEVRWALGMFAVHLVFQAAWTPLFFRAELHGWALADLIVTLILAAAATLLMAQASRLAAVLMAPYLLWLAYATALNSAVVVLN